MYWDSWFQRVGVYDYYGGADSGRQESMALKQ